MRKLRRQGPLHRLLLIVAAVSLFMIGYYWGNQYKQSPRPKLSAVMLRPPVVLPLEGLTDARHRPFDAARLKGHISLIAVGDSNRQGGRTLLTRLVRIRNRLVDRPRLQKSILIVFIDTTGGVSAPMADQLAAYGSGFLGVSGDPDALIHIRKTLGIDGDKGASSLFLADPEGRIVALFPASQAVDAIAADLKAYADAYR